AGRCSLAEGAKTPVLNPGSTGLLSISTFSPRSFLARNFRRHLIGCRGGQKHCFARFLWAPIKKASLSFFFGWQGPDRHSPNSVVQDAPSISSQNGVLKAELTLGHSVDVNGYTHYCYMYQTPAGVVEAPTLRLNQGDRLLLHVKDNITGSDESVSAMDMP